MRKPKYAFGKMEKTILERLESKGCTLTAGVASGLAGEVTYRHDKHDSIIAIVPTKLGVLVGESRRMKGDKYNEEYGRALAFRRAVEYSDRVVYSGD